MSRVPTIQVERSLNQALLVRLYSKGIRLVVAGDNLKISRVKGSKGEVSEEERSMISDHRAQLMLMLRPDRAYGAELIRDAHGIVSHKFPVGQGCSIGESEEFLWKAHAALDKDSMHGLWYWLDRYVERSLKAIEEFRGQMVLTKTEGV